MSSFTLSQVSANLPSFLQFKELEPVLSSQYATAGLVLASSLVLGLIVLFSLKLIFSRIGLPTKKHLMEHG